MPSKTGHCLGGNGIASIRACRVHGRSIFGSLALLLAMVGLYGITAYGVNRRQAELGIRIALGARQGNMIGLVLREVVVLLAVACGSFSRQSAVSSDTQ